jgi:NitT/TauT family transport system permease protein
MATKKPAWYARSLEVMLVLAGSTLLWELAVWAFKPKPFILPSPSSILVEFWNQPAYFLQQTFYTLGTTLGGFLLALALGFVAAVGIVYSRFLERTLYTLLVALNSVPKVALAPLFVIWMGTGAKPKIAIALTIAIFATVIDTVLGLRSVEPELLNLAKAARASEWHVLIKIRLPSALPSMFAGMKLAISLALVGAIVGEFVAGNTGLGQVILQAQGMFQTPRMFVAIIILGVLGTVLFYAVDWLERWLLPWHISQRGAAITHGA